MPVGLATGPQGGDGGASAAAVLGLAAAVLMALAGLVLQRPPEPLAGDAAPHLFSASRAMRDVEALAAAPRPLGSAGHAAARDHLLARMAALGLAPTEQLSSSMRRSSSGRVRMARVRNLIGRLEGTGGGPALLLVAHYDSRPNTPGAGDDASGVAVVLEAVRAVRAGPPPARDLVVLLTDAEELGLLGARAFAAEHPWMEEIGVVLNFEARGSRGPASMFETGDGALATVRAFAAAAPRPQASSISAEVYRRMPNDTDFTVFREAGKPGLNFAFIQGQEAYHTALDTAARLDPASLQHVGANAVALVRGFGEDAADPTADAAAVWFNPVGGWLVVLPAGLALALSVLLAAAALGLVLAGVARRRWRAGAVGGGLLLAISTLVLAPLAAAAVWKLLADNGPGLLLAPHRLPYAATTLGLALAAAGVAAAAALCVLPHRPLPAAGTGAGVALLWSALAVAAAVWVPGAGFVFGWPLIGLLAGLAGAAATDRPAAQVGWLAAGALPGVALLAPIAALSYAALTPRSALVALAPAMLALCLLLPLLAVAAGRWRRLWLVAAAGCVVLLALAVAQNGYDGERPRAVDLVYLEELDAGTASWLSGDRWLHPWVAERVGEAERVAAPPYLALPGERGDDLLRSGPAGEPTRPGPTARVADDRRAEGRVLTLRVASPAGAPVVSLHAESTVQIRAFELAGERVERPADEADTPLRVELVGFGSEEVEIRLELSDRWPLELHLTEQFYGLPPAAGELPGELVPDRSWRSHSTLVHRSFLL